MNGKSEMSEENVKKFFETLAKILSEREGVQITVKVRRKDEVEKNKENTQEACSEQEVEGKSKKN